MSTEKSHIKYAENLKESLKKFTGIKSSENHLWSTINRYLGQKESNTTFKNTFAKTKEKITINIAKQILVFILKWELQKQKTNREILTSLNKFLALFSSEDFSELEKNKILTTLNFNKDYLFQFFNKDGIEILIYDGEIYNPNKPLLRFKNEDYKLYEIVESVRLEKQNVTYKKVEREVSKTSNYTKGTIKSRIKINTYSDIVNEILPVFIGREFVFKKIGNFVSSNNKGYFYVRANPGIGKTSLSVKLVENTGYSFHIINPQRNGTDRHARDFISNICAQLIKKYNLSFEHFPEDYGDNGGFLYIILQAVSNKIENGEKAVIVVDGLDELKQEELTFFVNENILYLPDILPPNIFFVITMRDLSKKGIKLPREKSENYLIEDLGTENKKDVREFIETVSNDRRFEQYLKKHKVSRKEFLKTLEEKSEGNFMYLKYIFREILEGDYRDVELNKLPQGLEGYYKEHWDRMMTKADGISEDVKLKTIYVIANLGEPISSEDLTEIIQSDDETVKNRHVREIINNWWQFLRESFNDEDEEKGYTFYHKSFLDFLASDDIIETIGKDYSKIAERIELDYYHKNADTFLNDDDEL